MNDQLYALRNDLLIPPPADLANCVHNGLVQTLPAGEYRLPASLHPLLMVILTGEIHFDYKGTKKNLPRISLTGGMQDYCSSRAMPGTRIFTLSIRPGQFRRLLGMSASTLAEQSTALGDLLDGEARGEFARYEDILAAGTEQTQTIIAFFSLLSWLRRQHAHVTPDLWLPADLLDRSPRELANRFGISQRQFERRFLSSHGLPLRSYRQQIRCKQLLTAFVCGQEKLDSWANLATEAGYYDQSHPSNAGTKSLVDNG